MQDVSTAENAAEIAQNTYDAAIKKQAETAKAMSEVRNRLKSLQEQGKTLVRIPPITLASRLSNLRNSGRDQTGPQGPYRRPRRPSHPARQDRETNHHLNHTHRPNHLSPSRTFGALCGHRGNPSSARQIHQRGHGSQTNDLRLHPHAQSVLLDPRRHSIHVLQYRPQLRYPRPGDLRQARCQRKWQGSYGPVCSGAGEIQLGFCTGCCCPCVCCTSPVSIFYLSALVCSLCRLTD